MTYPDGPSGQYQTRRDRHAASGTAPSAFRRRTRIQRLRPPASSTRTASQPAQVSLKGITASLAALVLVVSYLLPAYAAPDSATDSASTSAPGDPQTLQVQAGALSLDPNRDQFLVTRTTLEGYQPYAHLADTFANNPNSAVQWPFEVGVPISSWFGYRECAGCSSDHQGIDFNPGEGTPIEAIADGVVTEVGNPNGSFGVYARISHQIDGQNVTSLYAHMLQDSLAVSVGDVVTKGQLVGQVGNTGQSTGAHLHFGLYLDGTTAIDPYPWMKEKVGS